MREVSFLGGRSWVGGVCADVCDPGVDECQETVEAASGQLAERDLRPQAGQVPLTVEPRDAQACRAPVSRLRSC
jgi:hypothetical protein